MNDFLRRLLFLPEQASSIAPSIDHLHYFVIITTMLMSAVVGMTTLGFFVAYRRRAEIGTTPRIMPGWKFEALTIGVPLAFFLVWFFIGFRGYIRLTTPPATAIPVYVMAKQWMWKFAYPGGPSSISVLRVPAHRPVRLLMTSRDVIHSFYVPSFRIKQDAVPGMHIRVWFQPTKVGEYELGCAELCGLGHYRMRAVVTVHSQADYDRWLAQAHSVAQR